MQSGASPKCADIVIGNTSSWKKRCSSSSSSQDIVSKCESLQAHGILRASPVSTILHGFGRLLADSHGCAATYELSEPVNTKIDDFLSHNWAVGRKRKFLVLTLHFNSKLAFVASMGAMCAMSVLNVLHLLPSTDSPWGKRGIICQAVTTPVFLLVLVSGHEIGYYLGIRRPLVFIDKTCIHQTDKKLKREGIRKLGAFISNSSHFVACYSDIYLSKLWTIYELACFIVVKKRRTLTILPIKLYLSLLGLLSGWYFVSAVVRFVNTRGAMLEIGVMYFLAGVGARIFTVSACIRQKHIQEAVRNFQITNATCADEEDRKLVEGNIVEFMKKRRLVPNNIGEKSALKAFDRLVKTRLPDSISKSTGQIGVNWRVLVMVLAVTEMPVSMDVWACDVRDRPFRANMLWLTHVVMKPLTLLPFWMVLESRIVKVCMRFPKILAVFALCATFPFSLAFLLLLYWMSWEPSQLGAQSDIFAGLFLGYHCVLAVSTNMAYQLSLKSEEFSCDVVATDEPGEDGTAVDDSVGISGPSTNDMQRRMGPHSSDSESDSIERYGEGLVAVLRASACRRQPPSSHAGKKAEVAEGCGIYECGDDCKDICGIRDFPRSPFRLEIPCDARL